MFLSLMLVLEPPVAAGDRRFGSAREELRWMFRSLFRRGVVRG
jgi:hypothetical protein